MLLFIIALIIFAIGATMDILSSIGQVELNPLWRNRDGLFAPFRNIVFTCVFLALGVALERKFGTTAGTIFLGLIGLLRIAIALRNWRVEGRR